MQELSCGLKKGLVDYLAGPLQMPSAPHAILPEFVNQGKGLFES